MARISWVTVVLLVLCARLLYILIDWSNKEVVYGADVGSLNHFIPSTGLFMFRVLLPRLPSLNSSFIRFKRFSSRMSSSSIVLPCEEIESLWFGGLDLGQGKPITMECGKRWFMGGQEFDNACQYVLYLPSIN